VLEAVYECYLMHYGEPRAFAGMDADLRLLAGDALYALGLSRLAEGGDLEAVEVLSDLISATARAQAEGRAEDAEALWEESSDRLRPAQAAGGAR
jgi:geranylgeranyl pyrophosphate synthase